MTFHLETGPETANDKGSGQNDKHPVIFGAAKSTSICHLPLRFSGHHKGQDMSFERPNFILTLQDVSDWTIAKPMKDYIGAVKRCEEIMDHRRLADIPADLLEFKKQFKLDGYDPQYHRSEEAYKAWRRKVIAAVKGASGELAAARERRARTDGWSELITRIEKHLEDTDTPHCARKSSLIPIQTLADVARQEAKAPDQITLQWLEDQRPGLDVNRFESLRSALTKLNTLRGSALIDDLLPAAPFELPHKKREQTLQRCANSSARSRSVAHTRSATHRPFRHCSRPRTQRSWCAN